MSTQLATRSSNHPLGGTSGGWRQRLLRFHVPLAIASALVLVLFMSLPLFDGSMHPHGDIFGGTFPLRRGEDHMGSMHHGDHRGSMHHGPHSGPTRHGGDGISSLTPSPGEIRRRSSTRQLTFATGYIALVLLALTLLIGPANLLLRRQNPVSNYLRRDVGMWTAIFSVVHVILGLQVHGRGRISDCLTYFVTSDGSPRLNSFGLGNWTGLAALATAAGLLAISSDAALRKLKARPWKWLQRLNYALFALVILHAFFYGALLRVTSPFTLLLGLSLIAVIVGQAVGVWLWRRKYARTAATADTTN